eukprot:g18420.t1
MREDFSALLRSGTASAAVLGRNVGALPLRRLMSSLKLVDAEYGDEEDVSYSDATEEDEPLESHCDRRCKKFSQVWLLVLTVGIILGPVLLVVLRVQSDQAVTASQLWQNKKLANLPPEGTRNPVADATLAFMIGYGRQMRLQASILVDISFGILTDQRGRLWTTSLALASILLTASMYTFWIYRPWWPQVDFEHNPLASSVLEQRAERRARTAWALVPNVGFVLAAMVPSLSDATDLNIVLAAVHNVTAPLSMLFLMVMETIQLEYGENAFRDWFATEPSNPVYGPLTTYQRLRVVLVLEAWIAGLIFVTVQGYLAFCPNRRHWVALVSYYGEVIGRSFWPSPYPPQRPWTSGSGHSSKLAA